MTFRFDMIIPFDIEFDATEMSMLQIRQHARDKGWPGIRLNPEELLVTGRLIVRRMSRQRAGAFHEATTD